MWVLKRNCSHCSRTVCTFHAVSYQQSTPTAIALICRSCFETQGPPLTDTLYSDPGPHGHGSRCGF
eukprot:109825-Amphidinium_carterae.1